MADSGCLLIGKYYSLGMHGVVYTFSYATEQRRFFLFWPAIILLYVFLQYLKQRVLGTPPPFELSSCKYHYMYLGMYYT